MQGSVKAVSLQIPMDPDSPHIGRVNLEFVLDFVPEELDLNDRTAVRKFLVIQAAHLLHDLYPNIIAIAKEVNGA